METKYPCVPGEYADKYAEIILVLSCALFVYLGTTLSTHDDTSYLQHCSYQTTSLLNSSLHHCISNEGLTMVSWLYCSLFLSALFRQILFPKLPLTIYFVPSILRKHHYFSERKFFFFPPRFVCSFQAFVSLCFFYGFMIFLNVIITWLLIFFILPSVHLCNWLFSLFNLNLITKIWTRTTECHLICSRSVTSIACLWQNNQKHFSSSKRSNYGISILNYEAFAKYWLAKYTKAIEALLSLQQSRLI